MVSCSEYELLTKKVVDPIDDTAIAIIDTAVTPIDTSTSDTAETAVEESAPIAVCSVTPNPATPPFTPTTFDGSGSYDPAGRLLVSHIWSLVDSPEGSAAVLPYSSGIYITGFYPDLAGEYTGELTVINDLGYSDTCRTVLEAVPAQNLWVEMFWQYPGDDMDLHLLAPGGSIGTSSDCYYANCAWVGLDWGIIGVTEDNPKLDIDDIPGTGPENINIYAPQTNGVYTVYVHDYPGSVYSGPNEVTINIYLNGSLVWTDTRPISAEDSYTPFALIDWAASSVTSL
jgi:hypothetical protein